MSNRKIDVVSHCFSVPKDGHSTEEYEDFCRGDDERMRYAIGDGATESSFAKDWVQLLVNRFIENPIESKGWAEWLPPLQKEWCAKIDAMTLPWFAEEKAAIGAYATFLGLVIQDDGSWRAIAVGDSCLFRIRAGEVTPFPIGRSPEFRSTPDLIGARLPADDVVSQNKEKLLDDTWAPGDQMYLMTDALAHWFVNQIEERRHFTWEYNPLEAKNLDEFTSCITGLRAAKQLKNDDVTLMVIKDKPEALQQIVMSTP
ncbi:MAG: protein phosphatase 2C domain-containing protein [Planctomycetes bacterium]|nr:protein phosphatase 2C domain-containing protein [Planctomycetota bacterium]